MALTVAALGAEYSRASSPKELQLYETALQVLAVQMQDCASMEIILFDMCCCMLSTKSDKREAQQSRHTTQKKTVGWLLCRCKQRNMTPHSAIYVQVVKQHSQHGSKLSKKLLHLPDSYVKTCRASFPHSGFCNSTSQDPMPKT